MSRTAAKPKIANEYKARLLKLLTLQHKLVQAADLALQLGLAGTRESKRAKIRSLTKDLRDSGSMIVATRDGYWLTDDKKLFQDYLDGRQIDAKTILAKTHKRKKMITDSNGQGQLFTPANKISCGLG